MKVNTRHRDYDKFLPRWKRVRDAIAGQDDIKEKGPSYLPMLNGQTPESYRAYKDRAVYTNFTKRTLQVALGQIFRKQPVVEGMEELMLDDVDLNDTSFSYFSRSVVDEILQTGRVGVWVDYDLTGAYMRMYKTENIINWRFTDGILSMVVLEGQTPVIGDDIFQHRDETTWTVLLLNENDRFVVQEYRYRDNEFVMIDEKTPLFFSEPLLEIPFYMITPKGITEELENAPLLDFVDLNLAHYRNSADYENMLHWTGAKTIITRGWGDRPFPVGGAADLQVDGGAEFLEASSDSGLKEELQAKEARMAIIGSSMISGKGRYVASAQTQELTSAGEYATLADVAGALGDSMSKIMTFYNSWTNGTYDNVTVSYNKDFDLSELNTQDLIAFMGAVQSGMMSWDTYFYNLKSREVYPQGWTMDDEKQAIELYQETSASASIEEFEMPQDEEVLQDDE